MMLIFIYLDGKFHINFFFLSLKFHTKSIELLWKVGKKMYILKNAFVSITRNKGRNILMGIIILVIACSSCITLAIRNSASKLVDSYANKYDIEATISMNRQNMMGNFKPGESTQEETIEKFNTIQTLTKEEIEEYGDSEYVSSYYYTASISLNSFTLEKATEEISSDSNMPDRGGVRNERMESGDFTLIGYSSYLSMSDFITGNYTIIEGSVSEDFTSNTCIINSELATLNNINIGDMITFVSPNDETITYELEVVGIYSDNSEESITDMQSMYSKSVNTMITNTTVIENIKELDDDLMMNVNPTFILTSKDVIDSFTEEVTEKGLSEYYQVSTNLDTITSETESISNVSNFATTFLILTLIIGGVVLFVLNIINVRERKYEIGVLRTIGMKKSLVISQFVLELLMVSIVSLLLGAGLGSILSVPTANSLLEKEINSSEEQMNSIGENFGKGDRGELPNESGKGFDKMNMNGVVKIEQVSSIHVAVDITVLLQMLGIGIILTLVSSLSAMISIARFSPITILKERS